MTKFLVSLIVSFFFVPMVYAQTCTDDSQCSTDLYYQDTTSNICIHKHGGYCDPSSEASDAEGCVYAFDFADDSLCQTPTPSSESKPITPSEIEIMTENISKSLPQQVISTAKPTISSTNPFLSFIQNFFQVQLYQFFNFSKLFNQSESIQQVQIPKQLDSVGSTQTQIQDNFSGPTGIFGENLPPGLQGSSAQESLDNFKQSLYPKGL